MLIQIIGYVAAVSLTMTLLPQLIQTYKTKEVNDISIAVIVMNLCTSLLFLVYGILLKQIPIILANCILILQNIILLSFKIIYTKINP
jgi:MtN3 and saliva related transmembrane protein